MKFAMRALALLTLSCLLASAAETTPGFVPNSTTTVTSSSARLYDVGFSLVTGASATITIKDKSTNCSGGPCQIIVIPLTTASPNASGTLRGWPAGGGFTWAADCANCATGWVSFY